MVIVISAEEKTKARKKDGRWLGKRNGNIRESCQRKTYKDDILVKIWRSKSYLQESWSVPGKGNNEQTLK